MSRRLENTLNVLYLIVTLIVSAKSNTGKPIMFMSAAAVSPLTFCGVNWLIGVGLKEEDLVSPAERSDNMAAGVAVDFLQVLNCHCVVFLLPR